MNKAKIRKIVFEAVIMIIVSVLFIIGGIYLSNSRKEERRQRQYRQQFASVINCDHYSRLDTNIIDDYPEISDVYIGYDKEDKPLGYIVDVMASNEYHSQMHLIVGIDYESSTINGLVHVKDEAIPVMITDEQFEQLKESVMNKRIPIAFTGSTTPEELDEQDDIVINGLHDGIYFAQSVVKDSSGYIDYVEIEIESGRISHVRWDAVNVDPTTENRSDASLSGAYRISGLDWATQSYNICHALIEVQDPALLNMKSDGTTSVIDGVTCDIRSFVELSDECIDYAETGYRKSDYLAGMDIVLQHILRGTAESLGLINDKGFVVKSFDKHLGPFEVKNSDGVVLRLHTIKELADIYIAADSGEDAPAVTPIPGRSVTPVPTDIPVSDNDDYIDGAEDGVINSDTQSDNTLIDSIDDLPMSEISSYINVVPGAGEASKVAVTCLNTCYKFMKEYLNWLV